MNRIPLTHQPIPRHESRWPVPGIFVPLLAVLWCAPAPAGDNAFTPTWKQVKNHTRIDVGEDGTTTTHYETAYTVLTESAARDWNQQSISYHDNNGTLEDVVAYTLKADGSRREVPPTNVQVTSHQGIGGLPPAFSDLKDRSIVYPDVEAGDTVYLSYTLRNEKPSFPGFFSMIRTFPDQVEVLDTELVVTAPVKMPIKTVAYRVEPAAITHLPEGRQQWRWTYRNAPPATAPKESDLFTRAWRYQDAPTVEISSFQSYDEVAAAYVAGSAPKAVVTDRIRKLAGDIVQDAASPREKAKRLFDWVAKEIRFAGNCLSGGDVVPRDTDLILNMKMGDCKDHATLLEALWTAQGIRSTQVLINTGSTYELPEVPCWQAFNHVLNYLPDFSLYVDATDSTQPFGAFPDRERGKRVLHVAKPAALLTTPPLAADANRTFSRSTVKILPDGSVDIHQQFEAAGSLAHGLRHRFVDLRKSPDFGAGEQILKRHLERYGYKGSGAYEQLPDAAETGDRFSYGLRLHIDSYIDTGNPYGLPLVNLFPPPSSLAEFTAMAAVDGLDYDFLCQGVRKSEELVFDFPDNLKLLAIPHGVEATQPLLRYDSQYARQGNRVIVHRTMTDDSPAPVCKAGIMEQYRAIAQAVKKDMNRQAVYQPKRQTR